MQLVLKALITIGDLPNPIEAAMVVGTCLELEEEGEVPQKQDQKDVVSAEKSSQQEEIQENRRTVRRRSAAN
ncbi:hypothetical protein EV06_0392 [Prochlorococcus sp. MIT 0602]|nr:hypothetical protein EV06_0392 [Prochlorococcus sp. MIT 0602]